MCGAWLEDISPRRFTSVLLASGILLFVPPAYTQSTVRMAKAELDAPGLATSYVSTTPSTEPQPAVSNCTMRLPAYARDMPSTYTSLSTHCKFEIFLKQTYSPYTFASALYSATWGQMMAQWPQYGGGMQGWGKRLGATLADTESRRFIQGYVLSSAFHQDPRYFPSRKKALVDRAWYAATRVLVTRGDLGQSELNSSELLGAFSTSSLQNLYYPVQYRTFGGTMNRFLGAISSDAVSDVLHEFTPDMKRLFHQHAPKRIQALEQRVPMPAEDRW